MKALLFLSFMVAVVWYAFRSEGKFTGEKFLTLSAQEYGARKGFLGKKHVKHFPLKNGTLPMSVSEGTTCMVSDIHKTKRTLVAHSDFKVKDDENLWGQIVWLVTAEMLYINTKSVYKPKIQSQFSTTASVQKNNLTSWERVSSFSES